MCLLFEGVGCRYALENERCARVSGGYGVQKGASAFKTKHAQRFGVGAKIFKRKRGQEFEVGKAWEWRQSFQNETSAKGSGRRRLSVWPSR